MDAEPPSPGLDLFLASSPISPWGQLGDLWLELIVFGVLLLLSATFSGTEVALFSLSARAQGEIAVSERNDDKRIRSLLSAAHTVLVSILLANTIVNVAIAILGAIIVGSITMAVGWPPWIVILVEILLLTSLLLLLGEVTPKMLASADPIRFARLTSGIVWPAHKLISPIARPLSGATRRIRLGTDSRGNAMSAEEVKTLAEIGEAHGSLGEDEKELIHSIVEFGDTAAREIMTSRVDIVAIDLDMNLEDALEVIRASRRSRLPLYERDLDHILGVVYARDLIRYLGKAQLPERIDWRSIMRPPLFVPGTKKLDDLLSEFQRLRTHLAIVVDEYGGTMGLVSLEDVLEEVIGDIQDEHDDPAHDDIVAISPGTYSVDARIDLDDLNDELQLSIQTETFDFETLGGLLFHLFNRIPETGDTCSYLNMDFTVTEITSNRIQRVLIQIHPT